MYMTDVPTHREQHGQRISPGLNLRILVIKPSRSPELMLKEDRQWHQHFAIRRDAENAYAQNMPRRGRKYMKRGKV